MEITCVLKCPMLAVVGAIPTVIAIHGHITDVIKLANYNYEPTPNPKGDKFT